MLCWQPSVQERLWKNNFMGHLSRKVKLKKTKVHIKCSQVRKMDQARTDKRGGLTTLVLIFFNVWYLFIYVNIFYVLLIQKLPKIKCDLHCDSSWKYLSAQNEWKVIPPHSSALLQLWDFVFLVPCEIVTQYLIFLYNLLCFPWFIAS